MNRNQPCSGGAAIDHDETGVCNHQPTADADLPQSVRDAITYSSDTTSPVLAALRDVILCIPTGDRPAPADRDALAAARVLLAAHARELADLVQQRIAVDRADNPGGGQMSARNHTRRGGMMTARWVLDRYADGLDQQATGGVS